MAEEATIVTELGELIRDVREKRGLSQRELGERAGVAGSTISFIERGVTSTPDPDTLISLAAALGIDQRTLFEKAGILPSNNHPEIPPELSDLIDQVIAMRDSPLYQQALKIMRETLNMALMKLDPPSDE